MEIKRVDGYKDPRFSKTALLQHGCFLADDRPYEVEIISEKDAVVRGECLKVYENVIKEFQLYAPHITRFFTENRSLIREFESKEVFKVQLEQIQPSQFYVDREKLTAISSFVERPEDIVIQVLPYAGRYISLDGHTRLYYAVMKGWDSVYAVMEPSDDWALRFAEEAIRRHIHTPKDMKLVTHEEYDTKWNKFCDLFFADAELHF